MDPEEVEMDPREVGMDPVRRKGLAKMNEVYGWEMPDMPGDYFALTVDHLFANIWSSTIDLHAVGPDGVPSADSMVLASFEQDGSGYGPWGMTVDRKSGDVLFMHYSRVYLYALRGFVPPESAP